MSEIRFYHLRTTTLEAALPRVLEKVLSRGERAVVVAGSTERIEALDAALWTYDDRSFLPHGSARDGHAEDQPVWLTTEIENPNAATMLVLTDGAAAGDIGAWPMACEFFDGNDEAAVAAARGRWKAYKEAGHALTYWRQDDQGKWKNAG
ncbi:MAG: DNA polymerase III subunit chi [Rhodospirillales bacterium]|nr:DNA polymerase III subunit chi [Rhodospirillales bacterium]